MLPVQRKGSYLFLLLAAAIVFGLGVKYAGYRQDHRDQPKVVKKAEATQEKVIFVHVAGAVKFPGLIKTREGARVAEVVKTAVPLGSADLNRLNLAAPVEDGQKITVPEKGGPNGAGTTVAAAAAAAGATPESGDRARVNINEADAAALEKLPGIGPALAGRILAYREKNGPFTRVEDLQKVSGIGARKYEELKDAVCLY